MKKIAAYLILALVGLGVSPAVRADELTDLKAGFEAKLKSEVEDPLKAGMEDLTQKYVAALERQQKAAQDAGQLNVALALRTEKENVSLGKPVPQPDEPGAVESMKRMRATYWESHASLTKNSKARARPIAAAYGQALDALKLKLTQEGRLNDAKAAAEIRVGLETAYLTPSSSTKTSGGSEPGSKTQPKSLAERIVNTKWSWFHPGTDITFLEGGKATIQGQDFYQWKVSATDPLLIEGWWSSRTFQLKVDKNFRTGEGVIDNDRVFPSRLLDDNVKERRKQ